MGRVYKNKRKNLQMFDINELNENLDFRRMVDEILVYIQKIL